MAVNVTLTVSPAAPNHGDTVTATYTVTGNDGTPEVLPKPITVAGSATVGADVYPFDATLTLPGTPAVPPLAESFDAPTATGLTFTATGDPKVFTALVP